MHQNLKQNSIELMDTEEDDTTEGHQMATEHPDKKNTTRTEIVSTQMQTKMLEQENS